MLPQIIERKSSRRGYPLEWAVTLGGRELIVMYTRDSAEHVARWVASPPLDLPK